MTFLTRTCSMSRFTKAFLRNDGRLRLICKHRIASTRALISKAESWKDLVAVAVAEDHIVGLKNDGTLVAAGNMSYGQTDVSGWSRVVAISASKFRTVGRRADGTILFTEEEPSDELEEARAWTGVAAALACDRAILTKNF